MTMYTGGYFFRGQCIYSTSSGGS